MRGFSKKTSYWVLGLLLVTFFGALWLVSPQWTKTGMVVLSGNTPPVLSSAQLLNHGNPTQEIEVVIGLNLRDEAGLDKLIQDQNDPASPEFRKYITPATFKERYAPTQSDVDKVVSYLQSHGITVDEVADNRVLISVRGTVKQFEAAFDVSINEYELDGKHYISNDRDPSVPANLRGIIRSVVGLSTFAELQSKLKPSAKPHSSRPSGYGARDIATAYNFPNQNNKNAARKYTGKGVTIAIATAYGYKRSDVDEYWKEYGIKRTGSLTDVHVKGKTKKIEGETTLDLQQAGAQAPGADIIMYIGKNPRLTTFAWMYGQIVMDNKADIVSISWGLCEINEGSAAIQSEHLSFKQGVAQGITFFAAAGDDGAYDCGEKGDTTYAVDYPSSDPYVTAVGGTALRLNGDGSRRSERAWSGGGGGTSTEFDRPSWQKNAGNGFPQGDKRETADVSLVADPNTGYSTYFEGAWDQAGGTSFAAPATAGLWALAQEATNVRIVANPTLYRLGNSAGYSNVFYDVTTGNNGDGKGPGFSTGTGWDHPTGWGSPDGTALVNWLVNDKPRPATLLPPAWPMKK